MVTIREYLDVSGHSLFAKWFEGLNAPAVAKVTTALVRIEQGNFSNTKSVGSGVHEYTIDFGPGYRIYFGKHGEIPSSSCWVGEPRNIKIRTFRPPKITGVTIRDAKPRRNNNAVNS